MRILIFIAPLIFFTTICYAQDISYGLPSFQQELHIGDRIIINIPNNVDGRFESSVEVDSLKLFLQLHSELTFVLSIHVFGGSSEFCLAYSNYLSGNLKKQLHLKNVMVVGKGNTSPLFLDKKSARYFTLNSRIKISIKAKK